jgi:hypothetical protein
MSPSVQVAVFQWILRRANGYFIYGTIDCGIGCGNGGLVQVESSSRPIA